MSLGTAAYFFLISAKWSIYLTHRPSEKSLFLHKAPSVKSTPHSPPLFHQEDAPEQFQFSNFNGSIYWQLCVLLFHFSVSWFPHMQFGVMYLKTQDGTQPYVAFSIFKFHSCFFVSGGTHPASNSLTLISQCLL